MKAIKKLFNTTTKLVVAIALFALLLVWVILFFADRETAIALVKPLLWSVLLVTVTWLAIHYGVKAWRKRKRSEFDDRVAAKEGIEDRRREWSTWTEELEKQGIDRYELPFYLLVGEPQSGKSVLLHNSDLHFPFGQSRLSGVGGTRGCDWWFTEEAVILDLAGRLFTHEGGAADRLEFEAFLELLSEFRPLCPANGVILVIPCDSLLKDTPEQCGAKATKIQNALLSLTTKLQAQLPVYLVLTKGDQIFGFADSVHRLDVERRHQMFGWSRPADKIDSPFDVVEVLDGFEELVRRARLLRGHMTAGARLPEALPEVDRMYAFPHELAGMQPNLEIYLKRVFTASNVTDRVFFRGVYLTSGLQSGVPIAKVCTELFGQAGEADRRNLEALFSKQRAYFIKDLIRTRVFGERGLVRPTQGRVKQTRRATTLAYGVASLIVLATLVFAGVYLLKGRDPAQSQKYAAAIQAGKAAESGATNAIPALLYSLQQIRDAVQYESPMAEKAFESARDEFKELYCATFDRRMVPLVRATALDTVEFELEGKKIPDHARLIAVCGALIELTKKSIDFSTKEVRENVLGSLEDFSSGRVTEEGEGMLSLSGAFELRAEYGDDAGLLLDGGGEEERLVRLARLAFAELEACVEPGARTQPGGELGFMLSWMGAKQSHEQLLRGAPQGQAISISVSFARCMETLKRIEETELGSGKSVDYSAVILPAGRLRTYYHAPLQDFILANEPNGRARSLWPRVAELATFANTEFADYAGAFTLSSIGAHFGSDDAGQTAFQELEIFIAAISAKFKVPGDEDPYKDLSGEVKLLEVCSRSLPEDVGGGRLKGLAASIVDLDTKVLSERGSPEAVEVFMAQCLEVADNLPRQVPDLATAQVAFGEDAPALLMGELVAIHRAMGDLVRRRDLKGDILARFRASQGHLESLIEELLEKRAPASAWTPLVTAGGSVEDSAWTLIDVLLEASRLEQAKPETYPLARTAEEAAQGAFAAAGNQLYERWQARPEAELSEIATSVREIGLLATQVEKRTALQELSGVELEAWSGRVDALLQERLGARLKDVQVLWRPVMDLDRPLPDVISGAERELAAIPEKIVESQKRGLLEIGVILKELEVTSPILKWLPLIASKPVIEELRQWAIPATATHVTGDPQFRQLQAALQQLRSSATGEGLAAEYAKNFKAGPQPPAANAGIRLVQQIRTELGTRLSREVREQYLEALQGSLDNNKNRELLLMLFWQPGDDDSDYDDTDFRDKLEAYFKRNGELEKLQKAYRLTGADGIQAELFPKEPAEDETEWAGIHRFLVGLSEFLQAGDEKKGTVIASRFNFTLVPEASTTGSVWHFDSLQPNEKKDWFYYPGDDSDEDLQKASMGPGIGKLKVSNWGFEANQDDRRVRLLWSKQAIRTEALKDETRYESSFPGCLGPLLLAWSGRPRDEETLDEYEVSLVLTGTQRRAPLRIQFERPVPVRPPKP